jgi:hypothetical protein
MSKEYFMAVFVVSTNDLNAQGRNIHKTISSYVDKYDNFEGTINYFAKRFAQQDFALQEITVFTSDINFKDEWESIKADDSIGWQHKNYTLLQRRSDINTDNVYCADGFKPRIQAR